MGGYIGTRAAVLSSTIGGTISGDLTVDSNTFFVDSDNNRIGIRTTAPAYPLQYVGDNGKIHFTDYGHIHLNNQNASTTEGWGLAPRDNGSFSIGRGSLTGTGGVAASDDSITISSAGVADFANTPTVSSSTIWHAGNDGAGSGLDADLLDGSERTEVIQDLGKDALDSSTDLDTLSGYGWYAWGSNNPTNSPADYSVLRYLADGSQDQQWVTSYGGAVNKVELYGRRKTSGTWDTSWTRFWSTANDGSGSGLDADLLDGVQGSSYLRSDADDTINGQLTVVSDGPALRIRTETNNVMAQIEFSSHSSGTPEYDQKGYIEYIHGDGQIAGTVTSNDGFNIRGTEPNTVVNVQGYLTVDQSVTTNRLETDANLLTISVDDNTGGSQQTILFKEGNVDVGSFEDDDFYVYDNINSGRVLSQGAWSRVNSGSNYIRAWVNEATDGTGRWFATSINAEDGSDPDTHIIQAWTREASDDSGAVADVGDIDATAYMLDQSGRAWHLYSLYAGRVRIGTTATTTKYRKGDNGVVAYSATGATNVMSSYYGGFTAIHGRESSNTDDVFQVFVGRNPDDNSGGQYTIEFDANGNGYFDGVGDNGNADYAEYFEWEDGNPNNEDRRGLSVVLVNGKYIRPATADDVEDDFLGIISAQPALVGDTAYFAWKDKWQRDKFGAFVYEDYTIWCWGSYDEAHGTYKHEVPDDVIDSYPREKPEDAVQKIKSRKVLNPDFDPSVEYTPRQDRPEWSPVGLLGKVPLLVGQPTKSTWRKLYDLNSEVEMWLVR